MPVLTHDQMFQSLYDTINFEAAHWGDDLVNTIQRMIEEMNEEEVLAQMNAFGGLEGMQSHPNWYYTGQFDNVEDCQLSNNGKILAEYISICVMGTLEL